MQEKNTKMEKELQDDVVTHALEDSDFDDVYENEQQEAVQGKEVIQQEGAGETQEHVGSAVVFEKKRPTMGRFKAAAKVFLSFLLLVVALGAIGFAVLWLIDNEQSIKFWEKDMKQPVEEVLMNVDGNFSDDVEMMEGSHADVQTEENLISTTVELSDPAALKVLALNGGGAKGSAGKAATYLKDKGYVLTESDNASIFTYKDVTVFYTDEEKKADAEKLKEVLAEGYEAVNIKTAETADEKKSDLVVIVGG